jgi:hypothetical protein
MHLLELFCLAARLTNLWNVFRVYDYELFVYVNLVARNNIFAALALKNG